MIKNLHEIDKFYANKKKRGGGWGSFSHAEVWAEGGGGAQQVLNVIFGLLTTKFNTKTKPFHFKNRHVT